MTTLAFGTHSNKGVYALLLGSGVSRGAEIPTGWEIVLDLIRKLAVLQSEDCEPNPVEWYTKKYKKAPTYSDILDALAPTQAERQALLKKYFEPSEEEREEGKKTPTDSHKAIAELVSKGYIKVILTTNFDRLTEQALEEAGIVPKVISSIDDMKGALPVAHTKCTIIKLHGDYLDTRIRNTEGELSHYDKSMDEFLDKIIDEYGFIICGWSAEWDEALRNAFLRSKNRRFTTYFTSRGKPGEKAEKLISARSAKIIKIKSANQFFVELNEKLNALDEYSTPHPLSVKIAIASAKKYLADDRHNIRLHDLYNQTTEELYSKISDESFKCQKPGGAPWAIEEFKKRVKKYEGLIEIPQALLITGCYWGNSTHVGLFQKMLQRLASYQDDNGFNILRNLQLYPALILLYSGGIAALAGKQYSTLVKLLKETIRVRNRKKSPLIHYVFPAHVVESTHANEYIIGSGSRRHTPMSDHLFEILREPLREIIADDDEFMYYFDYFEYILALAFLDLMGDDWAPIGCFGWRGGRFANGPIDEIMDELIQAGEDTPLLKAGLFGGSFEKLKEAMKIIGECVNSRHWN